MIRTLALAVGLILPLVAAYPALTQTAGGARAAVTVKDLDLDSRSGATTFLHRLDAAVAKVCGSAPDIRNLERMAGFKTCTTQTRAETIDHLNNAEVSAVASGAAQEAATNLRQPKT
jgi:UrcA family protein